ncbi:hypothetical protein V6N12_049865 [Hibiscus sabdariffa]|uniref:Uncharacterized protein n=1 Tax=Hibiscus sabdariffa TaxID=183260 RepID=A0ABR2GAY4_9ROSI
MPFNEWILMNLSDASQFVYMDTSWDVLFGSVLWHIWLDRNGVVFNNSADHNGSILERSQRLHRLCNEARNTALQGRLTPCRQLDSFKELGPWSPPCAGWVADYLARLASPLDFTTCVLETPPAGTVNLLQADGYG